MAKRPDWAMKSWTALNINEFILFDVIHFTHLHPTNDCMVPASFILASVTLLRRRLLFDCQLSNKIKCDRLMALRLRKAPRRWIRHSHQANRMRERGNKMRSAYCIVKEIWGKLVLSNWIENVESKPCVCVCVRVCVCAYGCVSMIYVLSGESTSLNPLRSSTVQGTTHVGPEPTDVHFLLNSDRTR